MSSEDAIKRLELLKAQIEWDYSIEYQMALDKAIEVLSKYEFLARSDEE